MTKPHPFLDPAKFWPNTVYLLLLSVAGAAVLEVVKGITSEPVISTGVTAGVCFAFSFGVWVACHRNFQRWRKDLGPTIVHIQPRPARASEVLVALCGPSAPDRRNRNPAFEAASYHRSALKHLWLITSHSGVATAEWINSEVKEWGVAVHVPVVLDDVCEVEIIKLKVEEVRREAIEGYRVKEEEVICDFTGMTKPVTAGMILACAPSGRRIEYLQGQYDGTGVLMADRPSLPIEIEIRYEIEAES